MSDTLDTIGQTINHLPGQKKDAIHMAVVSVQAGEKLLPGDNIGMKDGKAIASGPSRYIGIVDPFIGKDTVEEGDWFWMFMYPKTAEGLHHEWSHPDLDEDDDDSYYYDECRGC